MSVQLRKSVTIIVSTVVVENDNILMMQEAKPECFGLWYLPAGRLEKHESLVEGANRECREETGLEIEPIAVLSVEMYSPKWIRINFVGKVVGGELKKHADKESLSADWIPLSVVLNGGNVSWPLRANDIVNIVKEFVTRGNSNPGVLPIIVGHTAIQFQIYITWETSVLVCKGNGKVPTLIADLHYSIEHLFGEFYRHNFTDMSSANVLSIKILSIEFSGTSSKAKTVTDGVQFELTIHLNEKPQLSSSSTIEWKLLSQTRTPVNLTATTTDLPTLILLR